MADDISVKISELNRVNTIAEKDIIPFSTSLVDGAESTQAVSVAILRMIMANPTVYDDSAKALADLKAGDYALIWSDFTRSSANIFKFDGNTLAQLLTESGKAIEIPIASSATGVVFRYTAMANESITIPSRLIGTTGYHRIIATNLTYPNIFGEYVVKKGLASEAIEMSSAIVEKEAMVGKILINWPSNMGLGMTFVQQGQYEIRIY